MIKLERTSPPAQLTAEVVHSLTEEYKTNKTPVWNKKYIKAALLNLSNNKCCYCECNIQEESKYMEVEHFFPKEPYENKVVEWENLLPSCKRCNVRKGIHDPNDEPIINPFTINPQEHLKLKNYRLRPKSQIGYNSIHILQLNDIERLVLSRFNIGNVIEESLELLLDKIKEYIRNDEKRSIERTKITNRLSALLEQGLPHKDYSATVATIILNDENYKQCRILLNDLMLWNEDLQTLENSLITICLDHT